MIAIKITGSLIMVILSAFIYMGLTKPSIGAGVGLGIVITLAAIIPFIRT